jgi:hypothetical protein
VSISVVAGLKVWASWEKVVGMSKYALIFFGHLFLESLLQRVKLQILILSLGSIFNKRMEL